MLFIAPTVSMIPVNIGLLFCQGTLNVFCAVVDIKNGKKINNIHNDYKKYINFNVLDYDNKYCGKFFYNKNNEIDYKTNINFNK